MQRLFVPITLVSILRGGVVYLPNHGPISGKVIPGDLTLNQPLKQDVVNYLGIPFADPPVGPLRFAPPKKYEETWNETRAFTKYAKDCMSGTKGSEDCLYLNVFVPASASVDKPLPVMFYIYGGGFSFGRVSQYDGTALASQEDVIVVVPSYRFGVMGFFASNSTMQESNTTGNWGILDQRMALQWVNDNIAAFGGDKSRITIFGESAGAISVAAHMTSPGSFGLFNNAIIQSGVLDLELFYLDPTDSYKFYDWVASTLGHCDNGDDLECLRRVPASRFAIKQSIRDDKVKAPTWAASLFPFFSFGLTKDMTTIFGSPLEQALAGKVANVTVIVGLNQDEGTVFALAAPTIVRPKPKLPPTEESVIDIMEYFTGDRAFVQERFDAEFPAYRARYPNVTTPAGMALWKAEKKARQEAYKSTLDLNYFDVSALAKEHKKDDYKKVKLGANATKDIMIHEIATQFLSRDLANDELETICRESPYMARNYEESKGEEGRTAVLAYDYAPFKYLTSTARDLIFSCPTLEFAATMRDLGNKVFFYNLEFDVWDKTIFYNIDMKSVGVKDVKDVTIADLGVFHGADIPLVFKLFKSKPTHPADVNLFGLFNLFTGNQVSKPGDAAHKVADAIGCYWANLAKCGDVNCNNSCHGATLPEWPTVGTSGGHQFMNFGPKGDLEIKQHQQTGNAGVGANLPTNDQCNAWDAAEFKYLDVKYHNHNKGRVHHEM